MLNKRVPVLFEEKNYLLLAELAREENQSFGEMVRRTMDEKLKIAARKQVEKRKRAWKEIVAWRKKFLAKRKGLTASEILDLVREGRKYEDGN